MQLWCKKWFLVLAGIIVLAHNLTPHHHYEVARVDSKSHHGQSGLAGKVSHHHHDDGEEDESDGFAPHHSIDHAFVTQNFLDFHIISAFAWALPPVFYFEISTPVVPYYRITSLPANESPPAVFTIRYLSYRGPPSC